MLVVGEPTPAAVTVLLTWRRVLGSREDVLQTPWATLPVEVRERGLGQGLTTPLLAPDGGGQEKENTWERQEELGEDREAHTRRCTVPGSAGRWSPGARALSSGRLSSSPHRGFPLSPALSGDHHPKQFVS